MCQITIANLHDTKLNERLLLILGVQGSVEKHDDGWGVANQKGDYFKCGIPMHYTINSGEKIKNVGKKSSILLGHIRDASLSVPVNDKNAHPFKCNDIIFIHNGKLTPLKEEDYVMEEEVPDIDPKDGKQYLDKNGDKLFKKVKRSDSLIFFEEFIRDWELCENTYETEEEKFVAVVNETMNKFYGKFAMVFIINEKFYICRGKTADLHITYMKDSSKETAKTLGWAINTSRLNLDSSVLLLGNLNVLDGSPELIFSFPKLLKEETIFVAEEFDLREIGTLKEGSAPVKYSPNTWEKYKGTTNVGSSTSKPENFTKTGETELEKVAHQIYDWMEDYSLSPIDIQILLYYAYGASTEEVTVDLLKAFYKNVLVKLSNKTTKKIRKNMKRTNAGFVSLYQYEKRPYPWMLNSHVEQAKFFSKK